MKVNKNDKKEPATTNRLEKQDENFNHEIKSDASLPSTFKRASELFEKEPDRKKIKLSIVTEKTLMAKQ